VTYDALVLAPGSHHHYFGHPEWEPFAPGLKTIEDATRIRSRIFAAFEHAERERDPDAGAAWLTFVIVGGGPTGVELAGALAEIAHHTPAMTSARSTRGARIVLVAGWSRRDHPASLPERALVAWKRPGRGAHGLPGDRGRRCRSHPQDRRGDRADPRSHRHLGGSGSIAARRDHRPAPVVRDAPGGSRFRPISRLGIRRSS
jgi:hypothetical protein